jgi:hypothetical protein
VERLRPPKSCKTTRFVDRIVDRNFSILPTLFRQGLPTERQTAD